jgi:U3 small nucleolar RNA-associated protein 14
VKALPAPLPQRTKERFDREAAYEQTKDEVDKWSATMKRIKEVVSLEFKTEGQNSLTFFKAQHLSFPLQAQPPGRVSNLELTAKFKVCFARTAILTAKLTHILLHTSLQQNWKSQSTIY